MKVEVISRNDEQLEEYDYRDEVKVLVDGKEVFQVQDDEPEDSNLGRAFSDCYDIGTLMQMAYEAGKRGEEFELIS